MTDYPDSIDNSNTLPPASGSDAPSINANIGATIAIETELGIEPSGVYADVRTRLDILESRINNPLIPAPDVLNPFFISGTGVSIQTGTGDPNVLAVLPASAGSLYLRQDGNGDQILYAFGTDSTWHEISSSSTYFTAEVAVGNVTAGKAVLILDNQIIPFSSSTLQSVGNIGGIAVTSTNVGLTGAAVVQGPDPSTSSLGAGSVCAVGCKSDGTLCRITDAGCVSGLNYLGYCDISGAVTVAPRRAENLNVKDFGAIGDGVADDTVAIQNAVAFAKTYAPTNNKFGGTKIYFPKGTYLCSSQINFDTTSGDLTHDWPNMTLYGDGGGLTSPGDNRAASTLIFTGTGSGSFISARDTANFSIRYLCVIYQNPLFTGILVDCGAGVLDVGSTYTILDSCTFGCDGENYTSAAILVSVAGSYAATISNCHIGDAYYGIMIAIEGGGASASVITNIHNCQFNLCTTAAIGNPSFQTSIIGCTFEDVDRAVYTNFVTLNEPAIFGFVFASNWCGDNSNNLTPWIDFGNGITTGGAIYGNILSTASETDPSIPNKDAVKVGSAQGLTIYGNSMGTIDFSLVAGGSYAHGVVIYSNELEGTNSSGAPYFRNLNNNHNGCLMYGNYPDLDQMGIAGHIITWPTLNTAPGIVATTNALAVLDGNNFQGSNDTSGRITLTVSGGTTPSGIQCTVTFTNPFDVVYGKNPHVFLTPENDVTAALANNIYASSNGTTFTIGSINSITPGTYIWSYFVIQ